MMKTWKSILASVITASTAALLVFFIIGCKSDQPPEGNTATPSQGEQVQTPEPPHSTPPAQFPQPVVQPVANPETSVAPGVPDNQLQIASPPQSASPNQIAPTISSVQTPAQNPTVDSLNTQAPAVQIAVSYDDKNGPQKIANIVIAPGQKTQVSFDQHISPDGRTIYSVKTETIITPPQTNEDTSILAPPKEGQIYASTPNASVLPLPVTTQVPSNNANTHIIGQPQTQQSPTNSTFLSPSASNSPGRGRPATLQKYWSYLKANPGISAVIAGGLIAAFGHIAAGAITAFGQITAARIAKR